MGLFDIFARTAKRAPHHAAAPTPDSVAPAAMPALVEGAIRIFAGNRRIASLVPTAGVAVTSLPYVVGRVPEDDEDISRQPEGLFLHDDKPYRLSRRHFAIVVRDSRYWVVDGASHLGTVVNGHHLGRKSSHDAIALRPGANEVIAGGPGSEYVFRIVLG